MGQANIERVEFNGMAAGQYAVNSIISLNVHFHDSFVTHMKKNGPNSILKNNAILSVNNNQFEHTGGDAGVEHTFWSLTGFSFLSNFYDNYLEGTWGCFVRQGDPAAALIGLEVRSTFARQNPSGVPDVPNGKPYCHRRGPAQHHEICRGGRARVPQRCERGRRGQPDRR